jgi:hypothetical protein
VLCAACLPAAGSVGITFTGVSLQQGGKVIRVGSFMGPGIRGTDLWLLKDPTPVSDIPGYTWPSNLAAAAAAQPVSSSAFGHTASGGLSTAAQAALGVSLGVVGVLAVVAAALLLRRRSRRRRADQHTLLPKAQVPYVKGAGLVRHPGHSDSARSAQGGLCDVASVADVSCDTPSHRSATGTSASKAAVGAPPGTPGSPLTVDSRGSTDATSSPTTAAYHRAPSTSASAADSADVDARSQQGGGSSASLLEQSITQGLQRWSSAVSATTMHLMK